MALDSYEYMHQVLRSESGAEFEDFNNHRRLIHAALGLQTETAEFSDMLKRSLFYGSHVDKVNALEEMGDILWYMALVIIYFGSSFEDVMEANIAKLQFRYPDCFDSVMATVRDGKTEREILEGIFKRIHKT